MGPKRNKKQKDDDDEQFLKKQKQVEQMLKRVQKGEKHKKNVYESFDNDDSQDQAQTTKKKQVFNYQLTKQKQKALQLAQQKRQKQLKQKQKQLEEQKKLTPEEQKILEQKLEKQRIQKEHKEKKREEKKVQRQKQLQEQKLIEQQRKQQQQKQAQQVQKITNKPNTGGKCLPIFLLIFIITLCLLQYQRQIYNRLSKFTLQGQQNYYETFQIDTGATDRQLKQKYKRLVLKYHPDKNPNCPQCQDKFNKIIKAWQVLGNPEKRKHYDMNSGFITQIKSQAVTLTPDNYQLLVEGSKSLWVVQVYDSTEKYCHYFAQFWEEFVQQYGDFVNFGRVDVWTQSDMLGYMPYRFQVFPSIYYIDKGEVGLCAFDFQKPDWSVRKCIEERYKESLFKPIQSLSEVSHQDGKIAIVFGDKVKVGSRFKIVNKKYQQQFSFYTLKSSSPQVASQIISIQPTNLTSKFTLDPKNPQYHHRYQLFLQSLITQHVTICQFLSFCQDHPCFILLPDNGTLPEAPRQLPQTAKPVYVIEQPQFYQKLQDLKNRTGMMEKFNLAVYENGHIDLGYVEEADILKAEQGESFQQLHCVYRRRSIIDKLFGLVDSVKGMF